MTSPELVIIAGPNGSGKSTLTNRGQLSKYSLSLPDHYINPDDITREIQSDDATNREHEGWLRARTLRAEYRERRLSFAFETVLSHPSTLLDIHLCRNAGYKVTLIYVTTNNVMINIARVMGRVLEGGHNVPEDKIRERYERSLCLLPRVVEDTDQAIVFDSSLETPARPCFEKVSTVAALSPPAYLQRRLVDALEQRALERDEIERAFELVVKPDEAAGEYSGPIYSTSSNYAIQETSEGVFMRHDLLLTDRTIQPVATLIRYKDGVGTWSE